MSFIADRVVMDGLTFDDVLLIPATFRATASKFSKVVICIRSFLQILYHSSLRRLWLLIFKRQRQ